MKYYHIKKGRGDIYGRVIQVDQDPEAELEEKVKDFMGYTKFYLVKHEHFKDFGEDSIAYYEGSLNRCKNDPTVDRPPMMVGVFIDREGHIGVYFKNINTEIHMREINGQEAERLRESVHRWKQFQAQDMD